MQRYFIPADQFHEQEVVIAGDDARHLQKVMRCRVGDKLIACNGIDREIMAEIAEIGDGIVTASIIEELTMDNEPAVDIWIAQSLPKGDKLELVIQKCTEIGAARFIPFESMRTVVQYDGKKEQKRLDRWQRIAKEAAEQAHRNRIPAVDAPLRWKELLALIPQARQAWICYEQAEGRGLKQSLAAYVEAEGYHPGPLLLIVGPEGGFDAKEIEEAVAAGAICVGLGRRILRTETAAMVGLTAILYEYGEVGGE